ncbi:MAG: DnaJ domain-containing protein [Cyclobacteriaceae bacterium]
MSTYYDILELELNASELEIKAAFKKLALKYHPDRHSGSTEMEERFKEINQAYQVLSNPYQKARYDLQLKFPSSTQAYSYREQTYSPPPPRSTYSTRVDYKENLRATGYAFLFTLVVASVVMTFIGVKYLYDTMKMEEWLAERRGQYDQVQKLYASGDYDPAFSILNELGVFQPSEEDMADFKQQFTQEMIDKGQYYFINRDFAEALLYLDILEKHTNIPRLTLQESRAIAYRELNKPRESLKVYSQLLILGYTSIGNYLEMAEIYRDQLNEMEEARRYFEMANQAAIEYYKSAYGEAYPIVLSGRHLQPLHYRLYVGLAEIYLATNQPEKAVSATKWNIRVWPERPHSYMIAAKGYFAMEDFDNACENYRKGVQRGSIEIFDAGCR